MRPSPRSQSSRPSGGASGPRSRRHAGEPAPRSQGLANPFLAAAPLTSSSSASPQPPPQPQHPSEAPSQPVLAVFGTDGQLLAINQERQELLCSLIGLMVKLGLIAVAGVSLMRLAGAYQQRMERQGEITAVLELESAKLAKARERFDTLFRVEGEQRLIREQSQWIAPNRLRVVWRDDAALQGVQTAHAPMEARQARP